MRKHPIHASCVSIAGRGVLIRGSSGRGKSDLVLRLLDAAGFGLDDTVQRSQLVADDQTVLTEMEGELFASPPPGLAGKLEIRGQGIVELAYVKNIKIEAIVDLVDLSEIERMPNIQDLKTELYGVILPRLKLQAETASACARIRAFIR
jgi:HPr kinase/phosphorylase